jgi:glycosyltransferase involved in cell wall biosynthesis
MEILSWLEEETTGMTKPLVSIAIPVRNCETTVAAAVRSILNQTFQDWELLVLDDGSTDGTLAELSRFQDGRIKVLSDGHSKGLPARLNESIGLATGEYYARMDGDDVSYPNRLELQLAYLRSHPEVDLMGCGLIVFGEGGRVLGKRIPPTDHNTICRRPYSGFPMAHPAFFGRRKWFQSWLFRLEDGGACDQGLLLRSVPQSRFANLTDILIGYREEKILLRKCFLYRVAFCNSLVANCRKGSRYRTALGLTIATAKLCADTIAVSTGLQHRLLRNRARPVSSEDVLQWQQVWRTVSIPAISESKV